MSVPHHASPEEQEARDRLLDQFLHKAEPRFPQGRLNADDQGELAFAVALDRQRQIVILRFGKPVDWIGFGKKECQHLANLLSEKATQLT